MSDMAQPPILPGIRDDAHTSWPPQELIDSFLGNFDFEFRTGEHVAIEDTEKAQAAARMFRDTLGRYCSGVTVITTVADGKPVGMTCQSFSSVSISPPLVTFLPMKTSRAWAQIQRAGFFAVNFLADGQDGLSNKMASRVEDKFEGLDWTPSKGGAPLFDGIVGHVDCTVEAVHEAGDHYIVVGRVNDLAYATDEAGVSPDPLLYFQGAYRTVR
ncbi:flavin reductase family protein [Nocardioides dubius]|uniref:Flavin reductase like domain-containing protein n=2 Tax=Nocardioides dubius TaxID=317019 RepID=A0ABP4E865_9ACTN